MQLNRPPRSKPSLPTPAATNRASTKSKKNSQPPQIRAHQLTWTLQRRRRYDRRGVRDQESDRGSGRRGSLGIIISRARPARWWGAGGKRRVPSRRRTGPRPAKPARGSRWRAGGPLAAGAGSAAVAGCSLRAHTARATKYPC